MHVPDFKHEFGIILQILPQVVICDIHKVAKFAPRDVVGILWDKFGFNTFFKEFPSVTMVLPLLLSHCPPPCGGIAFEVGLGKLHGRMPFNLGGMQIILHFGKPSIHNLSVAGTIEVPSLGRLKPRIFGCYSFEGRHQLIEVGPIHFEEEFQLFMGEKDRAPLLLFTFRLILVLLGSWFLFPN
jgi:hypothetical protein